LDENILPPQGAYRRPIMRVAPYYEFAGVQFVWALPYSALAVARVGGRPDLARGFIENMLDFALSGGPDQGQIMRSVTFQGDQYTQTGTQTPLLAWLTRAVDQIQPDDAFLGRVYPGLAAFIDWWQSPRRDVDGDGLSEFAGTTPTFVAYESGHDYSPERDLVMGEPTPPSADGLVHEPFADVFLNACLYAELDALASMAARVDPGRAPEWVRRRDALAARMQAAMWDEEVGGFFPVIRRDLCPSQPRVYRQTPALMQPLWAGLAAQAQADRTVTTLLGTPRAYPRYDGIMTMRLSPDLYHGYQVVTDGLHPSRGHGSAAGGVEVNDSGCVLRFGEDRGPAHAAFNRLGIDVTVADVGHDAIVVVQIEDGRGRCDQVLSAHPTAPSVVDWTFTPNPLVFPDAKPWVPGLRRIEVRHRRCRVTELRVYYGRFDRAGLLSRFGLKSAHPLDGKHPALGAPTSFWPGTIWGPHNLHACYGLARYGHDELARAVARAYCDAVAAAYAAGGDAFEHFSHENGHGLGTGRYTWGAAVALVLMEDFVDTDV
jgi:hypothetical protein